MDAMEDSGFDSDPKPGESNVSTAKMETTNTVKDSTLKSINKKSDLQKKIERQRDAARKSTDTKRVLPSRSRLIVPTKNEAPCTGISTPENQPLVMIETDERPNSEDEFEINLSASSREIAQQLIKDGYHLDLEPDDEDLDLIPPRPLNQRCGCNPAEACSIL